MANVKRAKAMDVYGAPPTAILERLTEAQKAELDRYVGNVAGEVYRIAFDCGRQHMWREVKATLDRFEK
jgi:hypothetical protein